MSQSDKEALVSLVIRQIIRDLRVEDITALEILLSNCNDKDLLEFLYEEDKHEFLDKRGA